MSFSTVIISLCIETAPELKKGYRMIILHTGSLNGQLLLWCEKSVNGDSIIPAKRGRKPRIPKPKPYPYSGDVDDIIKALRETSITIKPEKKHIRKICAWLPTRGSNPVPSSDLVAESPGSRAKIELGPWIVAACQLSKKDAVELLSACIGGKMLAPGIMAGTDLAWWAEAFRFAGSLTARQEYLPGVAQTGADFLARWEPVITGNDSERLVRLANLMPPVARALTEPENTSPPKTHPSEILKEFITQSIDYLVRYSVYEDGTRKRGRRKKALSFHSVHDAWLHALGTRDGIIEYSEKECAQLREHVREWQRPIAISASSPFRLCFRLEEPEESEAEPGKDMRYSDDPWYVRYLLQKNDDPSLLIPMEEAWKAGGRKKSVVKQIDPQVREYMLSALGQASSICARIAASLKTSEPAGYEMTPEGAHEFLTEKAVMLEQAGFGVMLPAWWTRRGTKVRLAVKANVNPPKMQGGSGMTLESIVQFDWEMALGDTKLTMEELEELARIKSPLVRFRGQWVEMNAGEIQAAIEFWKKNASGERTVRDIVQMALGAAQEVEGIEFDGVEASGWIETLLKQLDGRTAFEEIAAPKAFSGTLRPYQVRGYSWLSFLRQWGLGACLADDMGLGKTIQALALIQRDWQSNGKQPVLLVCPTSVVNNWQKEAARFTPELPIMIHHGIDRKKGSAFKKEALKNAIVVTSYGLLQRDIKVLKELSWAGVVLDEAQNIKNPETKKSRAARYLKADYRIALTGTPVENNVGDLWSILEFLNPGLLGTQAEFKRSFFIPIQAWHDDKAAERLKRLTGPFILRRLKTDKSIISDLPDKMEMKVYCSLTKEQASLYQAVLEESEEALESSENIKRKGVILAVLSKLKQVCNHPAQFLGDNSVITGRSGKLARLTEMLEEIIEVGDRALLFSQFTEMGKILQRYLQETFGREVLFLHGGVTKKKRDRMVEQFQEENNAPPIFILSLKAGGTGLNLTNANHVFHFDRWWNPAVENQATDRAFRIGQTRNVQVHKFVCAGTLEEKIDEMIERKKEIAEKVVGTGEGWLTELSNDELKNILTLRHDAVRE